MRKAWVAGRVSGGRARRAAAGLLLVASAVLAPGMMAQQSGSASGSVSRPPSDRVLTTRVLRALAGDHVFDGMAVTPAVSDRVVTLSGTVTSEAAKELASKDAASVAGVRQVLNNLEVQAPVPAPVAVIAPPPPPPPPPPRTEIRQIVVPTGTPIAVRTTDAITSKTAKANDSFTGTVAADVTQDGFLLIPTGTPVTGRVVEAKAAGRLAGAAVLSVELVSVKLAPLPTPDDLVPGAAAGQGAGLGSGQGSGPGSGLGAGQGGGQGVGQGQPQTLAVVTDPISSKGKGRGANTAEKTAGGAGVGALIGGLAGGGLGAGIGALAGGGLGAGANGVTHGQEITLQPESLLRFTTSASLTVPVAVRGGRQVVAPAGSSGSGSPTLQVRPADGGSSGGSGAAGGSGGSAPPQ